MAARYPPALLSLSDNALKLRRSRLIRIAKILWVSPCTLVGFVFAAIVLLTGGRIRRSFGVFEITFRDNYAPHNPPARWLPFRAITLGHVIIAITRPELDRLREHEYIHVQQYESWGVFFFVAYAASSAWQLTRGRSAYWDNCFEVEARARSSESKEAG
jgi:hypothetical protein